MKRVLALYLHLCYKLEYHHFMQISLKNWLWLAIVAPPTLAVFRRLSWVTASLVSLLGILLLAGSEWAKRRHYLIFEPAPLGEADPPRQAIQVDEQIPARAAGSFAVGGRQRHVVNEVALYSFVRTREHIVMAYVRQTRFLLLTRSPKNEVGWWYVFLTPNRVQKVQPGYVSYGLKTRPGLAIRYEPEGNPGQVEDVYLAFDDVHTAQRVMADLRRDAPAQAFED
jgi:hypothetical protein